MATLYQVPNNNNLQYTLNSAAGVGDTTLTLSTTIAGTVNAPGVLVVDRVDSAGNKTPAAREYISFTGVSGTTVTGCTRGLGGSTAVTHAVGAIVEFVPDVVQEQAWYNVMTLEHGVSGQHLSLASVSGINTLSEIMASTASGNFWSMRSLAVASMASLQQGAFQNLLNASGASIQAVEVIKPVWVFPGTLSAVSAQLGFPLDMPNGGKIQFISAITRAGSSNASLFLDITKNGSSIIAATASTSILNIPLNGTFVSTSSIATQTFNAGDVFNFSVLNSGSMAQDLTVKFYAR